ncbi:hypothetical protein F751_2073 [Auxenochlorella protothecoides]|uniref:Uncharacterized protein n=1 Tax=Auxenochlorella protothecoides TaxID=3075 RepID=A0A087SL82_AUXPR|nr:hypothetical protein F751_2073 [Auxenochlorella protothecoides]KFM26486.1 hypothetical protein F751_2073 [Auxenochlorella protothecoides]
MKMSRENPHVDGQSLMPKTQKYPLLPFQPCWYICGLKRHCKGQTCILRGSPPLARRDHTQSLTQGASQPPPRRAPTRNSASTLHYGCVLRRPRDVGGVPSPAAVQSGVSPSEL